MHRRSLSAPRLAQILGISKGHVESLMRGEKLPSTGLFLRLLHVLNCTPDELLFDYLGHQSDHWQEHHFTELLNQVPSNDRGFMIQVLDEYIAHEKSPNEK